MESLSPKLNKRLTCATEKFNQFLLLNEKIANSCRMYDQLVQSRIESTFNPAVGYGASQQAYQPYNQPPPVSYQNGFPTVNYEQQSQAASAYQPPASQPCLHQ